MIFWKWNKFSEMKLIFIFLWMKWKFIWKRNDLSKIKWKFWKESFKRFIQTTRMWKKCWHQPLNHSNKHIWKLRITLCCTRSGTKGKLNNKWPLLVRISPVKPPYCVKVVDSRRCFLFVFCLFFFYDVFVYVVCLDDYVVHIS